MAKIKLSDIYASADSLTVLTLIKKLIDKMESFDVGQPLYVHQMKFRYNTIEFVGTKPTPYVVEYDSDNADWLVDGMHINVFFTSVLAPRVVLATDESYRIGMIWVDDGDIMQSFLEDAATSYTIESLHDNVELPVTDTVLMPLI